ncbi:3-hydroxyacyl-CoA dehydrogenase family protein [Gulosibacter macacae]|uniref:3-hydroxyacyl-CoA dehydrogenase family protein n=1 Tax=Gulosibacter macacae TaxID=2488791 RepID=A0A3P3VWA2_9MICO|nr:3-hydroxyacyl-CoA dehydrogenase family protein [Gulosibacter macacae]RRJ86298.1 3-hydroxyacyl-CoA dehydrogenase family protein [Gulosibacter macacae]
MTDLNNIPARVGVIGGGRMGGGIAHAFLMAGAQVTVIEREAQAGAAARERIESSVAKSIERGATDANLDEVVQRLAVELDYAALAGCELIVEAVFEDYDVKLDALTRAEEQLGPEGVLASNTSSISLATLAEKLQRPERFLGLHFFNPVPASTLIEVVIAPKTDADIAAAAPKWVEQLGKTPVVVKDSPGFASSRLGVAIALEAMRMVEEGVASAQDIDAAMELGYKHPSGPLKTTDIVGLDVRLGIAEYLHEHLGERFAPPQILRDKVANGELGRKSGKGFYDYS